MKRNLLVCSIALASTVFGAMAETEIYTYTDNEGYPVYGSCRRVSPNGKWAVGGDDIEYTGAFIINTHTPENITIDRDGLLLDVDDNGMGVGAWYEIEGQARYERAATYKDGVWTRLPLPESIIGRSFAVAVSADSKIIGGHAMCASEDAEETGIVGGKYFPILWQLNETTGRYEVKKLFNGLDLPGTMGFFVEDMSPNGRYLCGFQCLNMGDVISAFLDTETGDYKIWHELGVREISFDYGGKIYYNDVQTVDGIIDETDTFNGMFLYATDNYIFGSRDIVVSVNEDGTGDIRHVSTIYDIATDTFHDGRASYAYMCGVDNSQNFTTSGVVNFYADGQPFDLSIKEYLQYMCGVESVPSIAGIYSFDTTTKIIGGSRFIDNGLGDMLESPVLIKLEQPVFSTAAGIADIVVDNGAAATVKVDGSSIVTTGAHDVKIYTVSGALVATGGNVSVAPGIYIVVADGISHKVSVKQ